MRDRIVRPVVVSDRYRVDRRGFLTPHQASFRVRYESFFTVRSKDGQDICAHLGIFVAISFNQFKGLIFLFGGNWQSLFYSGIFYFFQGAFELPPSGSHKVFVFL